MDRSSRLPERLAVLILAGGLAVMGCGGGSDQGGAAAPASQEERNAETEDRDGQDGESVRAEGVEVRGGDVKNGRGEDGESVESGSSIVQSSGGGSVSSSNTNGSGIKTFSGTGSTKLSFNVEQRSRLVWTNTEGRRFSASGAGISIDSRAGRGEVALDEGDYDDVRVSGASWTIVVRSR